MSLFQTVLFKINYTITKLMDAILQNLQVWRANRKSNTQKHENNYTSKVEKTFNS